jgi:hypothetical protein
MLHWPSSAKHAGDRYFPKKCPRLVVLEVSGTSPPKAWRTARAKLCTAIAEFARDVSVPHRSPAHNPCARRTEPQIIDMLDE